MSLFGYFPSTFRNPDYFYFTTKLGLVGLRQSNIFFRPNAITAWLNQEIHSMLQKERHDADNKRFIHSRAKTVFLFQCNNKEKTENQNSY